jgi:hypothetical protein
MNSVWWLFTFLGATAAALVLIALAGVAVRQWRNAAPATVVQAPVMQSGRPQTSETVALEIIDSRTFEGPGLTVAFDDKHFVNCTFKNCTVHYDGGPYKLTSCRREAGNMVFVTTDRKIFGALHVWKFLGMMSEQATQIAAVEIQKDRLQT